MPNLLYLCHRIPFPPNKGDKIRSFHILKELAKHYSISLGAFIDDENDIQYIDELKKYCVDVFTIVLNPKLQRLRSLKGLLSRRALSVEFYDDPSFRDWVRRTSIQITPSAVFIYSSTMAQYLDVIKAGPRLVIDYVDVDSEKWRAYAEAKQWPLSVIYQRECELLGNFEREMVEKSHYNVFVSNAEAELFNSLLDERSAKVAHVNNGVDLEYFRPSDALLNPYPKDKRICVFTGAMDYWANVNAVTWFATEVFPMLSQKLGDLEFWIVGSRPTAEVMKLASRQGIHVTGSVADIRPYLQYANLAVAPMLIARGVQNKVLEAMAMERPVIGTSAAFEGLSTPPEYHTMIADDPNSFREKCETALTGGLKLDYGALGRKYVVTAHDWRTNMDKLVQLLEP
jgi:sugar transferase (PEP-CTERM/EpsH1 system associated)